MSAPEPVSAFSAFRAGKAKTNANKKNKNPALNKSKKTQNGGVKAKVGKKDSATSAKKKTTNPKADNNNKPKNSQKDERKSAGSAKNQNTYSFNESEVTDLVDELLGDPSKKLSKAQLKKKQELEDYLVKQLEMDDENISQDDDFDSEEEFDSNSNSNEFSDEYTVSGSSSGEDADTSESVISIDEIRKKMSQIQSKNIKRKATETTTNTKDKTHKAATSSIIKVNGPSEAKKSKNFCERKSLPSQKSATISTKDDGKRRNTLNGESERKASITTASIKLEPLSPAHNVTKVNSIDEGKRAFEWLINPVKVDDFFKKFWESKTCLIKRQQKLFFSHLISFEAIDQMLIRNHVEFTKNIDITSYKNGIRETLNPEGRAMPPVVWDQYGQGCSIRLLNPQTFLPNLYSLSTTMQEYFHCLVGANAYLTPPNSQGFAPHYDDIEAFVLQIEGRKRWKLYKPRNVAEVLPRFSSKNFDQKEIGKPILDEVLEPGDVLYFPRGTIHQASTEPGYHSLHITLSVYQKQSYADLFEKMIPMMLEKAIASSVELRRGLPLNTWQNNGIAFNRDDSNEREQFHVTVRKLLQKCMREVPIIDIVDAAVDQCAKKFQHEALPPEIQSGEKLRTVFGSHSRTNEKGECICDYDIDERTNVRLLRANIMRLVEEEGKLRIYYYLDNSKEYCQYEPNFIEIEAKEAASIEVLIRSYPAYVGVSQLPLDTDDQKITLATALWERGLLMMDKPFK